MRLRIDVDDEKGFETAREALLAGFEAWPLRSVGDTGDAGLLLEWKFGCGDRDLATWTTADLEEFLLEWLPRNVVMEPAAAAPLVASLREFFPYLAAERLLGLGSSGVPALDATLRRLTARVTRALDDPSRFGMGKSLLSGFAGLDLDVDLDPAVLQAAMDSFNSLPDQVRCSLLNLPVAPVAVEQRGRWDDEDDLVDSVALPPALAGDDPAVAAELTVHGLSEAIKTIRAYVGDGRRLTKKGNLTVADARALARQLALDSRALDGELSIPRFVVRSADDLPDLQFRIRLARAAGAVRVAKGTMTATATWRKLSRIDAVTRITRELLDRGPLSLATPEGVWVNHVVQGVVEDGVCHLLAFLWAAPVEPVPYDGLAAAAEEFYTSQLSWSPVVGVSAARRQVAGTFESLVAVLETAGVVRRTGDQRETTAVGAIRRSGGDVALTPLARATLPGYLRDHGYEVPELGELAGAPLSAFLDVVDEWHAERLFGEFHHWVREHGPEAASDEIVALAGTGDPHQRVFVAQLAAELGPPHDERVMRRLLRTAVEGHATLWLLDQGHEDVVIDQDAILRSGVDMFACQLDDPEGFVELLCGIDEADNLIEQIWRVPDPAAGDVLAAIGRHHPDKAVAKHARRALNRHRSHLANVDA